jgi:hypothetical protein
MKRLETSLGTRRIIYDVLYDTKLTGSLIKNLFWITVILLLLSFVELPRRPWAHVRRSSQENPQKLIINNKTTIKLWNYLPTCRSLKTAKITPSQDVKLYRYALRTLLLQAKT